MVGASLAGVLALTPAAGQDASSWLKAWLDAGVLAELVMPDFRAQQAEARAFYEGRGYVLAWLEDGRPTARARQLVALLEGAADFGLEAQDYDGFRWRDRTSRLLMGASLEEQTRFDLALTVNLLRFARDLHFGRVTPRQVQLDLDPAPKAVDLTALVARLAGDADVAQEVAALEPPLSAYRSLRAALPRYRELARATWRPLPTVEKLEPDEPYAGASALADFLVALGDLSVADRATVEEGFYGPALVAAVQRFQTRHGQLPDGKLGKKTFAALNVPPAKRLRQIELTLERWRWMPETVEGTPLLVNLPAYRLSALRPLPLPAGGDFEEELTMRVVVGDAKEHATPVFVGTLRYVVFQPFWNVPPGIQAKEVAPEIAADPEVLERKGYELRSRAGETLEPTPENLERLGRGEITVRQRPGSSNSLGRVKFILPNRYDVYLHDTPADHLFVRSRRDFSHGCIRVEDPEALARWVLQDQPDWTAARVRSALDGSKTETALTQRKIPVFVWYATAVAGSEGLLSFFEDIYGHDRALDLALRQRERALRAAS